MVSHPVLDWFLSERTLEDVLRILIRANSVKRNGRILVSSSQFHIMFMYLL